MLSGVIGAPGRGRRLRERIAVLALLALVPALLLGPTVLSGRRFLPHLPVALEPLASEHPAEAAAVWRDANAVLGDRVWPFLTDQIAMREQVWDGNAPTWEPALGLGVPLFGGSIVGAAYPPNWLAILVPPDRAAGPLAALSLFLAGLGAWLFFGRIGLAFGARAVGAIAMQALGFGVANLFYPMKVDAALWLPFSLWAVEGVACGRRGAVLALAASVAASFLAGFPPIALFCATCAGAYALVRLAPRAATLALAAAALALGVAGGAVQLLPTAAASGASGRGSQGVASMVSQALPPATILGVAVPELFSSPEEPPLAFGPPAAWWLTPADAWEKASGANALEWNAFAGVLVALLALAGVVADPRRAAFPALALVLVLSFATAFGPARWLYALPGFDVGSPARVLAVAWTLWAWLAALGADALLSARRRARPVFAGAAAALLALALVVRPALDGMPARLEHVLAERHKVSIDVVREVVPPDAAERAARGLKRSLAHVAAASAAGLAAVLAARLTRARPAQGGRPRLAAEALALGAVGAVCALAPSGSATPGAFAPLYAPEALVAVGALGIALVAWRPGAGVLAPCLLVALVAEGVQAAQSHLASQDGDVPLFPASSALDAVHAAAGDGRVVRYVPADRPIFAVAEIARPNMLQPYGVRDLLPWIVFTPRTLVQLVGAADAGAPFFSGVARVTREEALAHPVLDLLGVTAVLARDPPRSALAEGTLEPVLERPGFCVYRRAGALPAARVVRTGLPTADEAEAAARWGTGAVDAAVETLLAPGVVPYTAPAAGWHPGEVRVERPAPNRLDVRVTGGGGGWLVMHEQHDPGWRADVNGEPAELVRADVALRAVRIPPGDVVVRTRYAPLAPRFGLALSLAALAAAAVLGELAYRRGRSATNAQRSRSTRPES